jgi:hypothetical protein
MRMFHGDVPLGEADVFPIKPGPEGALPFPSSEIRISHLSPPSERCPPLAILQTIAPFSVRCKLQANTLPPHPSLQRLYLTCFNEFKVCIASPLSTSIISVCNNRSSLRPRTSTHHSIPVTPILNRSQIITAY